MEKRGIIAQTERLILRRYTEADLQDLWEYLSDEEVVAYEPYKIGRASCRERVFGLV